MNIFRYTSTRIWLIVTVLLAVIIIAANIVLTSVLPGLMDVMFGGDRHVKVGTTGNDYFTADEGINDKVSAVKAGNDLVERICEEGFILLKNDDNILPFTTDSDNKMKVSVFGKNSVNLAYGGVGSVGDSSNADNAKTIFESLTAAGFDYNTVLEDFYKSEKSGPVRPSAPSMSSNSIISGFATGETPVEAYSQAEKNSFNEYNDAAIVVISRVSGENYDLPLTMKNTVGAYNEYDHYLEPDKNEQEMLKMVCENFSKVVLVINSATPIELGFLDTFDDNDATTIDYDFASKIQAAIWIGLPGEAGIMALGRILNGSVNPSGKTVDTFARDFTAIPAVANFSCNGEENTDSYYLNGNAVKQYFIDYEEGIYIGYKYFETRGFTDGEEWYRTNVVYPFGYGLTYTTFKQEITATNIGENSNWDINTKNIYVTVKVTNTGSVSGKEVVQLYVTAPYIAGGIEKAYKSLIGYAKTDIIPAGGSEELTISFNVYDLASYDYSDANANGFKGYEVEAGDYIFTIGKNAHEAYDEVTTNVRNGLRLANDTSTGYAVVNRFDDLSAQLGATLSRSDWIGTMPKKRTLQEKNITQSFIDSLNDKSSGNPLTADDYLVKNALKNHPYATSKDDEGMQLWELIGVEYDTDDLGWNEMWDEMIKRITLSSIWDVLSSCAFTSPAIDYIVKPATIDTDGPAGFTKFMGKNDIVFNTTFYCSECNLAATWNNDLAYKMGVSIGNEGLIGDTNSIMTYSGWYAPGVNLHRTPFGGRNPEYYSEDSILTGKIGAQVIKGAKSKGVYSFVKHFAANEQETHRGGVCTWLSEQAFRELYLKPFEICVKEGGTTAVMSSFNRIGTKWTGGDYRLITEVLRNEWGFKGSVICDFASNQSHMDFKQMVYAGGDMWLDTITPTKWYTPDNGLDVYVMQEGIKHVLYTVVNSNAMNGIGEGTIYKTSMAYWRIILIVADAVAALSLALWGFVVIRKTIKTKNNQ